MREIDRLGHHLLSARDGNVLPRYHDRLATPADKHSQSCFFIVVLFLWSRKRHSIRLFNARTAPIKADSVPCILSGMTYRDYARKERYHQSFVKRKHTRKRYYILY